MNKAETSANAAEAELEQLDDEALARLVKERANEPTIPVGVEDLLGPNDAGEGGELQAEEMRGEYRVGTDSLRRIGPEAVTRRDETVGYAALTHPMRRSSRRVVSAKCNNCSVTS